MITTVIGWIDWVYNHAVVIVMTVVVASFAFSYFGKKNRRWA